MINLKLLKKFPEDITKKILEKDPFFPVDILIELSKKYHSLVSEIGKLNEEINKMSDLGNQKEKNISQERREQVKGLKKILEELKEEERMVEKEFTSLVLSCPNILAEGIPQGNKEANQVVRRHGKKPEFYFPIKNHLELLEAYSANTFSFPAKTTQSGFVCYEGKLAWIIYKLAMICLKHNESYGFKVIHIPQLANSKTVQNAGNLPRFKKELFYLDDRDLILIPTAEVVLASYCHDKSFSEDVLPVRLTSWTRCYRKEAGGYGAHERGLIRIHEFEKIEIFSFVSPEKSETEHEYLVSCVEHLLQKLNLHYQVVLLAAQDTSFSSQKTYDIELWLPGQNDYKEVSSISNCGDFQARRSCSKVQKGNKSELLHSLNGSSLALPRLMVALLETWQDEAGVIRFDELFAFLDGLG